MDITINSTSFHLPAEIVDLIAAQLSGDLESIKNLRLVNKLFNRSATPHICDLWASPSQLFTLPDGVEEYSESTWPLERKEQTRQGRGVTTWTQIQVPESVPLEDESTFEGLEMRRLLWAPLEFNTETSSWTREHPRTRDGRLASCWGRLIESPQTICIMHHWPHAAAWDAYRSSAFARSIKEFLDRVAPGCIATSRSERMVLPRYFRASVNCLYNGYHEFRTIYFPRTMSDQQRQDFEGSLRPLLETKILGDSAHFKPHYVPGAHWSWLTGLRNFQGEKTFAMRFVFPWGSSETEQYHQRRMEEMNHRGVKGNLFMSWKLVDISTFRLQDAGVLGTESSHCKLETGPHH